MTAGKPTSVERAAYLIAAICPRPAPVECALCNAVWDITSARPFVFIHNQHVCDPCREGLSRPDAWLVKLARWLVR